MKNKKIIKIIIPILILISILSIGIVLLVFKKTEVISKDINNLENAEATDSSKVVDVILFSGQSNMRGKGSSTAVNVAQTAGTAYEYKASSNSLVSLQNPVEGADGTNLVPSFCKKYVEKTGRKVVAVHLSFDATAINGFIQGTDIYNQLVDKYNKAIACVQNNGYTVGKRFYVFLQGEWDVVKGSDATTEQYKERFLNMHNGLKRDLGIQFCGLIYSGHLGHDYDSTQASRFTVINNAQKQLVNENSDIYLATDITVGMSMDNESMVDDYHYGTNAYIKIGESAGNNIGSLFSDRTAPTIQITSGNGSSSPVKNVTVGLKVTDDVQVKSLKYIWTTSASQPSDSQFTNTASVSATSINSPSNLNGSYYLWILAEDSSGNKTYSKTNVFVFDNSAPKGTVSYSTTATTNKDVTVTITSNEALKTVSGWTLSLDKLKLTKVYNSNKTENVAIADLAGNTSTVAINVSNIDKTAPVLSVSYSIKDTTNTDVTVTVTSNKQVQSLNGWNLSQDKKVLTKTYSQNTKETIAVTDLAGNIANANIEIINIDKVKSVITVGYSTIEPTNKDVTVNLNSNKELRNLDGWEISGDKKVLTKTYSQDIKEKVTATDLAGNQTEVEININNIDKIKPTDDMPNAEASINDIKVSNNQKDEKSGISKIEYAIYSNNWSEWQTENTFYNLESDANYKVKTRVTDKAGNVQESKEKEISTLIDFGNLNNDEKIDEDDITTIQKHIFNEKTQKKSDWKLNEKEARSADVTGDGKINVADVLKIKRYIATVNDAIIKAKHEAWTILKP